MKYAVVISLSVAAGCLPSPGAVQAPECFSSNDCPVAGQECQDGLCFGDAPPGQYAALIAPASSNRHDLVVTEIPTINIPQAGDLGDQIIAAPVHIGGRVHLGCTPTFSGCDPTAAIAATITVTRPSRIQGGPEYVDAGTSDAAIASGDSFTMDVPRLGLNDSPYTVTITPDDTMSVFPNGPTAAALVPPLTIAVDATQDVTGQDLVLGQGALRAVSGRVVDATGAAVPGVKVAALGRFTDGQPLARVSTVAVTDLSGYYTIDVAQAAQPTIDIVGVPADKPSMTMRLAGVVADQPQQLVADMGLPATGKPISVTLSIVGHSSAGLATPVVAASVDVTATLDTPGHASQLTTYEVVTSTDTVGNASLMLLPASGTTMLREYHVRINPAPSAEFATVYDQPIEVGTGGGVLGEIDLPHRIAVTGTLLAHDGTPAPGVTITAQPALSLTLKLDAAAQALLSSLQPTTTTTLGDGSFSVWVDPQLAGSTGIYDLVCVPPAGAPIPRATYSDVMLGDSYAVTHATLQPLPQGRHVQARIVDQNGAVVVGAEFRLYATMTDPALCTASHLPASCALPATLLSVDTSEDDGKVRLVVPDSRP
jgi:hypothetical protein